MTPSIRRRQGNKITFPDLVIRPASSHTKYLQLVSMGGGLDLHPSQFSLGRCARTRFVALPAVLRCAGHTNFECIVVASYQDYLLAWLADAAEEFLGYHTIRSP